MSSLLPGHRQLSEDAVQQFKSAVVERLREVMKVYGEQNYRPAAVRETATRCNMATGEVIVWFVGLGALENYQPLADMIATAIGQECEFALGDGFCENDTAPSRKVGVRPKQHVLEKMRMPSPAAAPSDADPAPSAECAAKKRRCCSAWGVLAVSAVVAVGSLVGLFSYVMAFSTITSMKAEGGI